MDDFGESFGAFLDQQQNRGAGGSTSATVPAAGGGGAQSSGGSGSDFAASFGGFLDDADEMRQRAARTNLIAAGKTNPDAAAKAAGLAADTGLPVDTVERNLGTVDEQVRQARQAQTLRSSPFLTQLLGDQQAAKVAHDDFEALSTVEKIVKAGKLGFEQGILSNQRGRAGYALQSGQDVEGNEQRIKAVDDRLSAPDGIDGGFPGFVNWFAKSMVAPLYDSAGQAATLAAGGALTGAGIGALATGAPTGGLAAPVGAAAGAGVGAAAGFGAGLFSDFFKIGSGNTYASLKAVRDANGNGIDEGVAQGASVFAGLASAALNTIGVRVGGKPFVEATDGLLSDAVKQAVAQPTIGRALANFTTGIIKGGAEGAVLGIATEGANLFAEQFARIASSGDFQSVLDDPVQRQEAIDRLLTSAVDMAAGMALIHTPARGVSLARDMVRARTAASDAGFMQDLMTGAAASKTRGRAGDVFRDFLASQTDGSPVENIFIPGDRVLELYQDLGVTPGGKDDPVFGFVPDMGDQVRQAAATGGDVVVPLADYVTHLAGSDVHERLKDDIRVRQDGMSLRELQEWHAQRDQLLAENAVSLKAQTEHEQQAAEPVRRVFDDIFSQLREAGQTVEAARQYAALVAARYGTRSARLEGAAGDPFEMYQREGVQVRRVLPDSIAHQPVDQIDMMIAALRDPSKLPTDRQLFGPSLAEFIARRGGIVDTGGELKAMDADKWHKGKPGMPRLVREAAADGGEALPGMIDRAEKNDHAPDEVARAAWEAGYFPEHQERPAPDDLFEALRTELGGSERYAADGTSDRRAGFRDAVADLGLVLSQLDIDPAKASNAEIRAALDGMQREAAQEPAAAARSFDQKPGGGPVATLRGDELGDDTADAKALRSAARDYYRDELAGRTVSNPTLGDVTFTKRGLSKAVSASADPRKLQLFPALPEIIENGTVRGSVENRARDTQRNILRYHFIDAQVRLGDETVAVRVSIEEHTDGKLYYNHVVEPPEFYQDARAGSPSIPGGPSAVERRGAAGAVPSEVIGSQPPSENVGASGDRINMELMQPDGLADRRGSIRFEDGRTIISLYRDADLSTFLHENGHLWLEEMIRDAALPEAPEALRADMAAVLKWLGVEKPEDIGREQHEQFARGVEAYLMDGRAPSEALRRAFQKFKAWLVSIYRAVKNLDVPINDEIRGVMDRLVATDEEIQRARDSERLNPLFLSAEQAGMTDAEFRAYVDKGKRASDSAETALLKRVMGDIRRQRTAEWKAEEDTVREDVEQDVRRRPDLKAAHFLRTGKLLDGSEDGANGEALVWRKLSKADLVDLYGSDDVLKLLPRGIYTTAAEGAHPDLVAEMFGYRSGDELVRALMSLEAQRKAIAQREGKTRFGLAQHVKALVDEETHARMVERHGDMLSDGSIEEEALAAVHNDAQAEMNAIEMARLALHAGQRYLPVEALKDLARSQIASMPIIRARSTYGFARAEARAGLDAQRALLKRDYVSAFLAKQRQVLNQLLFMEARAAADDYERGVKQFSKFARKLTMGSIDQPYLDRIHDLLERFGFGTRRNPDELANALDGTSLEAFVQGKLDDGREIVVSPFLLDDRTARAVSVESLPVERFRGLADTIRSLAHNGREEKAIEVEGERQALDMLFAEAEEQFKDLKPRTPSDDIVPAVRRGMKGAGEAVKDLTRRLDATLLKPEQIFDWLDNQDQNGVFNRVVLRRLKAAEASLHDLRAEAVDRLRAIEKSMPRKWGKSLDAAIPDAAELRNRETGNPFRLRRKELLAIALNVGNESNFDKLIRGYGWDRTGVMAVLERHMSRDDWRFVQGVWDTFEHFWPRIEAMERRLSGVAPDKVEPRAFEVRVQGDATPVGVKGGYFPVVYDPLRSVKGDLARAKAGAEMFENTYARATTPKGHTISRTEFAEPIHLSLDNIPWKLGQHLHDLAFREAIIDADKFLRNPRIREGVKNTLGLEYYKQFRPWLQSIANSRNIDERGLAGWERLARQARINTMVVGIGFRLSTMMKHGSTALLNSFGELGTKWMLKGASEFFGSPAKMARARDFVFERSSEMRHRMNEIDRDVRESLNTLTGEHSIRATAARFGHYGVAALDMASALPTWMGAYRKAQSEGMAEADAIYAADKAVRRAHGAQGLTDMAAIQRGTETQKLFTMFYGFFNHIYNRQRDTLRMAGQGLDKVKGGDYAGARRDFAMVLARSFFYLVMPALIEHIVAHGLAQEDESWFGWGAKAILGEIPAGIPILRDIAKAAFDGRGYEMSPVAKMVESTITLLKDGRDAMGLSDKEVSDRWVKHAVETPGYIFGLPTGQASGTVQYLWDVWDGKERPGSLSEMLQGLAFGPPKKH